MASYDGLTTSLVYDNAVVVDVTKDPRVSYTVVQNTCGATIVNQSATIGGVVSSGMIQMRASFGEFQSEIVEIECVETIGIVPYFVPLGFTHPGQVGSSAPISRVNCAENVFQSGRMEVSLNTSSNELVFINHTHATFSMNDGDNTALVLRNSFGPNGFSGMSVGFGTVHVVLGPFTNSLVLEVVDESVYITDIVVARFPQDTLAGPNGLETTIDVDLTMSDTTIHDIFGGGWPDYTPQQLVNTLVNITTNDPASVRVNTSDFHGKVILVGNSFSPVSVSVSKVDPACPDADQPWKIAQVSSAIPVSGNVELTLEGDVDMGSTSGVPIIITSQSTIPFLTDVPVRVKSSLGELKGFEIMVGFDMELLTVHYCVAGPTWLGTFSCTIDNMSGTLRIIGGSIESMVKGDNIHVATFAVFTKVQLGTNNTSTDQIVTRLNGVRDKISTSVTSSIVCSRYTDFDYYGGGGCPFVAGDIPILIVPRPAETPPPPPFSMRRRLMDTLVEDLPDSDAVINYLSSTRHWRGREILHVTDTSSPDITFRFGNVDTASMVSISTVPTEDKVYGDANGDGVFDISDYLFAQEFYNGAEYLGCPVHGGHGCQDRRNMTEWQVCAMYDHHCRMAPCNIVNTVAGGPTVPCGRPICIHRG